MALVTNFGLDILGGSNKVLYRYRVDTGHDGTYATDLGLYIQDATIDRGVNFVALRYPRHIAALIKLQCVDTDDRFNPWWEHTPITLSPNNIITVKPGQGILVEMLLDADTSTGLLPSVGYWEIIGKGWIQSFDYKLNANGSNKFSITAIGFLGLLDTMVMPNSLLHDPSIDDIYREILSGAILPSDISTNAHGDFSSVKLWYTVRQTRLEALRDIELTELGILREDKTGDLHFIANDTSPPRQNSWDLYSIAREKSRIEVMSTDFPQTIISKIGNMRVQVRNLDIVEGSIWSESTPAGNTAIAWLHGKDYTFGNYPPGSFNSRSFDVEFDFPTAFGVKEVSSILISGYVTTGDSAFLDEDYPFYVPTPLDSDWIDLKVTGLTTAKLTIHNQLFAGLVIEGIVISGSYYQENSEIIVELPDFPSSVNGVPWDSSKIVSDVALASTPASAIIRNPGRTDFRAFLRRDALEQQKPIDRHKFYTLIVHAEVHKGSVNQVLGYWGSRSGHSLDSYRHYDTDVQSATEIQTPEGSTDLEDQIISLSAGDDLIFSYDLRYADESITEANKPLSTVGIYCVGASSDLQLEIHRMELIQTKPEDWIDSKVFSFNAKFIPNKDAAYVFGQKAFNIFGKTSFRPEIKLDALRSEANRDFTAKVELGDLVSLNIDVPNFTYTAQFEVSKIYHHINIKRRHILTLTLTQLSDSVRFLDPLLYNLTGENVTSDKVDLYFKYNGREPELFIIVYEET